MEKETNYKWFPEIPARPRTFLGIQFGMHSIVPAGWNEYIDDDGNEQDDATHCRKQSSYFNDYDWYRIDEKVKKIYNKAHVEIRFGYKQSLGVRFESNEEAQAYVDELIESSDKQFHVIINN